MLPLFALGLGILAGNRWLEGKRADTREAELAQKFAQAFGQQGGNVMGPPDESGGLGYQPGSGLVGSMANVPPELAFLGKLGATPGLTGTALQALPGAFQRIQQGDQFTQQEGRLTNQFERQIAEQIQARLQGQNNWERNFGRSAFESDRNFGLNLNQQQFTEWLGRQNLGISQAQLKLAQQKEAFDQATARAAGKTLGLPTLPQGYRYIDNGAGGVVAAPMPGIPAAVEAQEGADALEQGLANARGILDTVWGPAEPLEDGTMYRAGGSGFERWGPDAGKLATSYAALRSSILRAEGSGVIDKGEREEFESRLANPSKLASGRASAADRAAYEDVLAKLEKKRDSYYKARPWLVPPPPAGFTVVGGPK